jgi:hypothetical protein
LLAFPENPGATDSAATTGMFPNLNVVLGSTCEAGRRATQLDQALDDATLAKLTRPLHVFTGLQFEEIKPVGGDVLLVGDCAKPLA